MHKNDWAWRGFAELANEVSIAADALLVEARNIGNSQAIEKARAIRDSALDLWRTYKDSGSVPDAAEVLDAPEESA